MIPLEDQQEEYEIDITLKELGFSEREIEKEISRIRLVKERRKRERDRRIYEACVKKGEEECIISEIVGVNEEQARILAEGEREKEIAIAKAKKLLLQQQAYCEKRLGKIILKQDES
jgi:hypothetical protein